MMLIKRGFGGIILFMDISQIMTIVQVILAVILMTAILLQSRGAGLGEAFGGSSTFYGTRRGGEKWLFNATMVVAVLFVLVAIINLFVS